MVGISFWRQYASDKPRAMGLDEVEFACDQRILWQRHE
jgi:hypothetical protein